MRNLLLIPALAALALFATGCEKQGPAERAGEQMDEALDEVKEGMEEAGEEVQEAAEEAGDELKEAGEEVKDAVDGK